MRKLVWTGTTLSTLEADGAWISGYDEPTDAVPPMTKLGLEMGSTAHRTIFGHKTFGNGAYAILQYLNNEGLLFNSFVYSSSLARIFLRSPESGATRTEQYRE